MNFGILKPQKYVTTRVIFPTHKKSTLVPLMGPRECLVFPLAAALLQVGDDGPPFVLIDPLTRVEKFVLRSKTG